MCDTQRKIILLKGVVDGEKMSQVVDEGSAFAGRTVGANRKLGSNSSSNLNKKSLALGSGIGIARSTRFNNSIIDTRKKIGGKSSEIVIEDIPELISGSYTQDYDIRHIDRIIKKKLEQSKYTEVPKLKSKLEVLKLRTTGPQRIVQRKCDMEEIAKVEKEISDINSGAIYDEYVEATTDLIEEYKKLIGTIERVKFSDLKEDYVEPDEVVKARIGVIDRYIDIANKYIEIDIVRVQNRPADMCIGCNFRLKDYAPNEDGLIICPQCGTEHANVITAKMPKDGNRINSTAVVEDESIDNFLRAFTRYQGLQSDRPDPELYDELDEYFVANGRLRGKEVREMPLDEYGRRGDTNHRMLLSALSKIRRPEYYEHVNLIGHLYWGWTLPDVMQYRETIIDHYNKTQKVFYQIPPHERERTSSIGTQWRLFRHLQLVGHKCYIDEFKIAENSDSLNVHAKLWKLMCDGCDDPNIYYIE